MSKKLTVKILLFILVFLMAAGIIQTSYGMYLASDKESESLKKVAVQPINTPVGNDNDVNKKALTPITKIPMDKIPAPAPGIGAAESDSTKMGRPTKKEIDISRITLSSEVEETIYKKDSKNSDKNITNFKKLIAGLDVPDSYRNEIQKLLKNKYAAADVFVAYEFLYENYGLIGDLEGMLNKKESGLSWSEVFKEYKNSNPEFIPSNFKTEYLEGLMKTPNISADDIMIADRLSRKDLKKFDELIEKKKSGKSWKDIKTELGVVNTEEKLPRFAITSTLVKKLTNETGLSEKEVIEALVISGKLDKDENEIVQMVKQGMKKEYIYARAYDEKYR